MYPEDCLQSVIKPSAWWTKNDNHSLCRGALISTFAPHVDQIPYTFEPIGRTQADQHDAAILRVSPLSVNQPLKKTDLPVAAMTLHEGEVWAAYRAKRRPCLVIGSGSKPVDKGLTAGMANSSTASTILVAPYYGAEKSSKRGGYRPEFIERIRHCEYPQFVWDHLPIPGGVESILRLDHIQPMGTHHQACRISDFKLSDDALCIIDELLGWLIWGGVKDNSLIALYRQQIEETFP